MIKQTDSLFHTLKSHAVFRVATLYAIVGWLLIQFADISLEAFVAPDWIMRLFLIIVLAGFPVTLVFSWLINRANLSGAANTVIATGSVGIALAISAFTYQNWSIETDTPVSEGVKTANEENDATPRTSNPVIAILPFSNLSSTKENEYLADGMTEDIITLLAQSPGVDVVARNSTFKYKNTNPDVRDVGSDLHADYVVEGSIRPIGERIRVTLQVIDASSGSHIWAEKYDRPTKDFFDLQDEVSLGVAAAVGDAVFRTEYKNINQSRTGNLSAWALTSQADVNLNTLTFGQGDIERARQAIELDPNYALAYAVLGRSLAMHTVFLTNETLKDHPALAEAEAAVRTAQKLAPNDPKVLAYLAITLLWTGQPQDALPIAERVPQISPSYAEGLAYYGDILIHNGRPMSAIPQLEKAIRLTPNAPQLGMYNIMLSEAYIHQADWANAEQHLIEALRNYGGNQQFALRYLAGVQLRMGKLEEARASLGKSYMLGPERPLQRDEDVMKFYTLDDGGEHFIALFEDLIALREDTDRNP